MENDILNRGWYFQGDFIEVGLLERSNGMRRGTVMVERKILGFIPIRLRIFLRSAALFELADGLVSVARQVREIDDAAN